jgi:hypothetical protein
MGHGLWRFGEDILILEARALNKAHLRICSSRFGRDVRQLYLVDNMSVALAFERRRASSSGLLIHVRRFSAMCFARNVFATIRWIPSEFNSSDEGRSVEPV